MEGVSGAAGLAEKLAGVDQEMVEDAAASTREATITLNEDTKVGGSGCDVCARGALPLADTATL